MALPNRLYIMLLSHVALSGNHKLLPEIYAELQQVVMGVPDAGNMDSMLHNNFNYG